MSATHRSENPGVDSDATGRKRAILGWVFYDFAESTFSTSILVAVLPIYFLTIAPPGEFLLDLGLFSFRTAATSVWGYTISFSTLLVAIISPFLGAVADFSGTRKRFLAIFGYTGAFCSGLLFFAGDGDYMLAAGLFAIANIGSAGGTVFYNSLLPEVARPDEMDWVSGRGFSMGYLGGGILLVVNMLMISYPGVFGISDAMWAARWCFVTVGVWWALFALPTLALVNERPPSRKRPEGNAAIVGWRTLRGTLKDLRNYRDLLVFFAAYLVYNDGIQTVIVMATPFGKEVLRLEPEVLMGTLVLIQAIGIPGSLAFGKLAQRWGAKQVLLLSLVIWTAVVIYAWQMTTPEEYLVLGVGVGLVLGGSQAISRSLYAAMIPKSQAAEFYGFLSFSSRFASFLGPLAFALARDLTGSMRVGILVLIGFFVVGGGLLLLVDVPRGIRRAK
jgi:MFS transporter, UMF1 family